MALPRIYADFNSLESLDEARRLGALGLTGYGTLQALSRHRIRLRPGMRLSFCAPNDIEVVGEAFFDRSRTDPAGRRGQWMARVVMDEVVDCVGPCEFCNSFPCMGCGNDLRPHLALVGRRYREFCPHCGLSVMAALAPPDARLPDGLPS